MIGLMIEIDELLDVVFISCGDSMFRQDHASHRDASHSYVLSSV